MKFTDLGLSDPTLKAIAEAGYDTPTPIQGQAIPIVLMGRDILGCAQTGTGKTASFTLPMIDILSSGRAKARMPRSLIMEPTRELAAQVYENFETYGRHAKLTSALLIGGESFDEQEKKLNRGVDVLIATPGRLLDLFERGKVLLRDVKVFVIDEADRMLDMGFIPDIERIVTLLPPLRQTLLFSATMPKEIRRLADRFLSNPKEISVSPQSMTANTIDDVVVKVESRQKRKILEQLLVQQAPASALIFCNRKRDVDTLFTALKRGGHNVGALHGDMVQDKRTETLERFRSNDIAILVASDVAARGLDIPRVSHVFNYDVPNNPEDYVHRIGRTGRAGRTGKAFMLATADDDKLLANVERVIGRPIRVGDAKTAEPAELAAAAGTEPPATETPAAETPAAETRARETEAAETRAHESRAPETEQEPRPKRDGRQPAADRKPRDEKRAASGRGGRQPRRDRDERRDDRRDDRRDERRPEPVSDKAVKGFGDNVPAFLQQSAARG